APAQRAVVGVVRIDCPGNRMVPAADREGVIVVVVDCAWRREYPELGPVLPGVLGNVQAVEVTVGLGHGRVQPGLEVVVGQWRAVDEGRRRQGGLALAAERVLRR